MFGSYLVAIGSALFAGCSALTWIYAVHHMDPIERAEKPAVASTHVAA
jgi:hypothetical protein